MHGPLQFQKRSQHFIGTHDETFSIAMSVNNPDRSLFKIESSDLAQAPIRFMEIVGNDFLLSFHGALTATQIKFKRLKDIPIVTPPHLEHNPATSGSVKPLIE
jgi:hypothetical protein